MLSERPETLAELFLLRADDHRPGLRFEDDTWTWAEHVQASVQRAAWLRANRQPGPFHIGVLLDNQPEFSFLLGAAAMAGATVACLNPTRNGPLLAEDINLTDCQLLITETRKLTDLAGVDLGLHESRIWCVDSGRYRSAVAAHHGAAYQEASALPEDLLLLIFTSGTSGKPKAVRVTHRRLLTTGYNSVQRGEFSANDVVYLTMPMFHSSCLFVGWLSAVTSGATMVIRRRFSASQFLPDVRRYGATVAHYVGKTLAFVLATPELPDDASTSLRLAMGNEAAELDIERFAKRFGCRVYDAFGSTEGGLVVLRTGDTPQGSIGKADAGIEVVDSATGVRTPDAVFDRDGRLLNGDAAIGELVNTRGPGAFAGYYKNGEADAERMRGGWFWTGDLAYRDCAGFLFFVGRTLDWLRVDSENFGAAPVERLLARMEGVSEIAVYAVPAIDAGDEVMAALVLHGGVEFDPDLFRGFLAAQPDLGTKWAPRFVRIANDLPRTPTNKILKRRLATEAWAARDQVWWRRGRSLSYELLDGAGRAELKRALLNHGREHLLPQAPTDAGDIRPANEQPASMTTTRSDGTV